MTDTVRDNLPGVSRRSLLGGAAAGIGITLTGALDTVFGADSATAAPGKPGKPGKPRLRPATARWWPTRPGGSRCPQGFSYTLVAVSGQTVLETGEKTPDRPDGTASFVRRSGDGAVLVQNHELTGPGGNPVPHHRGPGLRRGLLGRHHDHRGRRPGQARSASTSASPAPTTTAPAARRRGTPGSAARRPRTSPPRPTACASGTATSSRSTRTTTRTTRTRSRSSASAATPTRRWPWTPRRTSCT